MQSPRKASGMCSSSAALPDLGGTDRAESGVAGGEWAVDQDEAGPEARVVPARHAVSKVPTYAAAPSRRSAISLPAGLEGDQAGMDGRRADGRIAGVDVGAPDRVLGTVSRAREKRPFSRGRHVNAPRVAPAGAAWLYACGQRRRQVPAWPELRDGWSRRCDRRGRGWRGRRDGSRASWPEYLPQPTIANAQRTSATTRVMPGTSRRCSDMGFDITSEARAERSRRLRSAASCARRSARAPSRSARELLSSPRAWRGRARLDFAIAQHEHVRHLLLLRQSDLVLHPARGVVDLDANAASRCSTSASCRPASLCRSAIGITIA